MPQSRKSHRKNARPKVTRRIVTGAESLENDPRFLRRIEKARESLRAGRGVRLEDVKP